VITAPRRRPVHFTLRSVVREACSVASRLVGVAQLVEHLVVVQDVAGSSPVTHPNVGQESGNDLRGGSMTYYPLYLS
jgi:hypothetical protein